MLTLEAVEFRYPEAPYAYHFSMQVQPGEIACVSGRSGSGKSTLLDLIAGFLTPISGEIVFADQKLTHLPPDKRPVSIVFQRNNLFEHRNALDNVVVGIDSRVPKKGPAVERARQILSEVGLANFEQTRVSDLSGGQQQRVAIARAIVRQSRIILLDEPFSALDQQTRSEMLSSVRLLASDQNRAIIMVTHDLRDCRAVANSHYVVEEGQLRLHNTADPN